MASLVPCWDPVNVFWIFPQEKRTNPPYRELHPSAQPARVLKCVSCWLMACSDRRRDFGARDSWFWKGDEDPRALWVWEMSGRLKGHSRFCLCKNSDFFVVFDLIAEVIKNVYNSASTRIVFLSCLSSAHKSAFSRLQSHLLLATWREYRIFPKWLEFS